MAHKVWLITVIALVAVAFCGCKPQTARELGISGLTQYDLAKTVSNNCWKIVDSSTSQTDCQRLSEHNPRIASFISPSMPWAELRQIAQSQGSRNSDAVASPSSVSQRLLACSPDKLRVRDESYYTVMDDETNEARDDRLSAIMGWDGMYARALAITSAEAKLRQAEEIEKGTGCEFLTDCAKIALAHANDDQSRYFALQMQYPIYDPALRKTLVGHPVCEPSMSIDELHSCREYAKNVWAERYETRLQDGDLGQQLR
ncbi:MAG: hypothetical protein WCG99_03180 [Candidatus Berkelbacteria bacterium]